VESHIVMFKYLPQRAPHRPPHSPTPTRRPSLGERGLAGRLSNTGLSRLLQCAVFERAEPNTVLQV
jgi:hypothetical protein